MIFGVLPRCWSILCSERSYKNDCTMWRAIWVETRIFMNVIGWILYGIEGRIVLVAIRLGLSGTGCFSE